MKTIKMMGLAAIGIAALCVNPAQAGVSFRVNIGMPVFAPPPVVVVQQPVAYPAPVIMTDPCPAPVVVVEPPVCQPVFWARPGHVYYPYRHEHHRGPDFRAAGWHGRR